MFIFFVSLNKLNIMIKKQGFRLLEAFKTQWLPDNGYLNNGVNDYPRIEVSSGGDSSQIDKGDNSKTVDLVFDIITENFDAGEAQSIAEVFQDNLINNPIEVPDFVVDMTFLTGDTPLTEENADDQRTINRLLLNYQFTLTQINF